MNTVSTPEQISIAVARIMTGTGSPREKLQAIRDQRDHFLPAEVTEVMDRAIADLVRANKLASALRRGDIMSDFTLADTDGVQRDTADLLRSGPLVISFYRGSWCPYCNIELNGLQAALPDIRKLGGSVVAVAPELPERQNATARRIDFPLLHDVGNRVAQTFGIAHALPPDLLAVYRAHGHDLADVNGAAGATILPLPATFVIGQDHAVRPPTSMRITHDASRRKPCSLLWTPCASPSRVGCDAWVARPFSKRHRNGLRKKKGVT
jgi:peroxiredoxin